MTNNINLILFNSLLKDDYDSFVENLFNYNSLINNKNIYGETLLHYACYFGLIEKYYALINIGCEITTTNHKNNLLHYASASGKDNFIISELIKLGISPLEKNIFGETSLHCSSNEPISHQLNIWCRFNNFDIISLLDNDLNSVAHSCMLHGNNISAKYWINQFPILNDFKNKFNKTWQECSVKKFTTSLY